MSLSDPIANAITKIRNAYLAKHKKVFVLHSNMVEAIVKILDEENFINGYSIVEVNKLEKIKRKQIYINLRYTDYGEAVMKNIERISKPGRRVYVSTKEIPSVYNNTGCAIISTNMGVMVDREAREKKSGGEYICKVW